MHITLWLNIIIEPPWYQCMPLRTKKKNISTGWSKDYPGTNFTLIIRN